MSKNCRVGLYARVSTAEQQTLPMQISAMRDYCDRRGWDIVASIEDIGSGAKERPKREELLKAARRRHIDTIVVWKLDRWGRSLKDLVNSLEELNAIGVGFVSVTDALDLTTPSGRALAGMLSVFAQFERDILLERVKNGIAQAKKKGTHCGRPRTIDKQSEKIQRLFAEGLSKRRISHQLGIARSSVLRALRSAQALAA
jgi:DNA invertase Pin-like site-specific DNA recombinase